MRRSRGWRWLGVLALVGCGHGGGPAGDTVDAASPPPDAAAPCTMTVTGALIAAVPCQVFVGPHSLDASHPAVFSVELPSHTTGRIEIDDAATGSLGAPRSPLSDQSDEYIDWDGSIDDGTNSWKLSSHEPSSDPPYTMHIGTFTLNYQPGFIDHNEMYTQAHGTLDATLVSATAGTVTVHVTFSQSY